MADILFLVLKAIADGGLSFFLIFVVLTALAALGRMNVKLEGWTAVIVWFGVAFYLWYFLPPFGG